MKIRVLRMKKLTSDSKLKAFVDVIIDEAVIINGCQIFQGPNGMFAMPPSQKNQKDGKYYPVVKISDQATANEFNHVIMAAFNDGAAPVTAASAGVGTTEVPF